MTSLWNKWEIIDFFSVPKSVDNFFHSYFGTQSEDEFCFSV